MFGVSVDKDKFQRETTECATNVVMDAQKFKFLLLLCVSSSCAFVTSTSSCNGILLIITSFAHLIFFPHSITNKIVKGAVSIKLGLQNKLELGNLDAYRDWGHQKIM